MIIGSAAYFKVCRCGGHGRIIAADGTWGPECASKEAALCSVEAGCLNKVITELEVPELKHMIETSELSARESRSSFLSRMIAGLANEMMGENPEEVKKLLSVHEEEREPAMSIPSQWKM